MENNETHSDSRHTFGHEDIDALEERDEGRWDRPGKDLRANLYKYILGLIVLVVLVLGSVLYLLNPFGGDGQGIPTERLDVVQTSPADRMPPKDTAVSDGNDETDTEAPSDVSGEPSSKYISMQDEEELKPTAPDEEAVDQIAALDSAVESEAARKDDMGPSGAVAPSTSAIETGSESETPQEAAPSQELSDSPKPLPVTIPEDREEPPIDRRTRVQSKPAEKKSAPETRPAPETRVSKAEPSPRPEIPQMPLWYVQVGAFSERSNAVSLKARLVDAGFPTSITSTQRGNRVLHITRVGPYPSRVKAEIGAERLRKEGHQAVTLQLKQ